jgi:hypothetical protein
MPRYPLPPLAMDYESRGTFAPFAGLDTGVIDRFVDFGWNLIATRQTDPADARKCPDAPAVGDRVRLRRDIFANTPTRGLAGTVTISQADELAGMIAVRLDTPFPGACESVLYWTATNDDDARDEDEGYAVRPFWKDCARIVSPEECR